MKRILFIFLFWAGILSADRITVFNASDQELYGAVYSVPKIIGKATRVSNILTFAPQKNTQLDRTIFYPGYDRELVMSTNKSGFQSEFSNKSAYTKSVRYTFNIGGTKGTKFFVEMKDGQILGYTQAAWDRRGETGLVTSLKIKAQELGASAIATVSDNWIIQKANDSIDGVVAYVSKNFLESTMSQLYLYWKSPFSNHVATVRIGNAISSQEKAAINTRLSKVRASLQKKIGPLPRTPKIAVVASGGGYRAMLFTLGFLVGAEKTGLLDSVLWITSLSGSTWGVAHWITENAIKGRMSVAHYQEQFLQKIKDKKLESPLSKSDLKEIGQLLLADGATSKPMTTVNLFGALLANRLFDDFPNRKQLLKLSDQRNLFAGGNFPIPIYTAVSGEPRQKEYFWYGYTPWEMSLEPWQKDSNAIAIPIWACGRAFENGKSTGFVPEQSLGFQLGTFGSAFAIHMQAIEETVGDQIPFDFVRQMLKVVASTKIGQERLSWGAIHNYMKGVKESPFSHEEALRIVDGGFAFNLPYPPVSGMRKERFADILIFLDASDTLGSKEPVPVVRKVVEYAQSKGLKLPKMNLDEAVSKSALTIFESDDPSVPTVIYMPATNDLSLQKKLEESLYKQYNSIAGFDVAKCTAKEVCSSLNFKYSYDEALRLSMVAEFNVLVNQDRIFEAIANKAGVKPKVAPAA